MNTTTVVLVRTHGLLQQSVRCVSSSSPKLLLEGFTGYFSQMQSYHFKRSPRHLQGTGLGRTTRADTAGVTYTLPCDTTLVRMASSTRVNSLFPAFSWRKTSTVDPPHYTIRTRSRPFSSFGEDVLQRRTRGVPGDCQIRVSPEQISLLADHRILGGTSNTKSSRFQHPSISKVCQDCQLYYVDMLICPNPSQCTC